MAGNPVFQSSLLGKRPIKYPWGLTQDDVETLMEAGDVPDGTQYPFIELVDRADMAKKMGLDKISNRKIANNKAYQRIRYLAIMLQKHPGMFTGTMRLYADQWPFLKMFFTTKSIRVLSAGEDREVTLVQTSEHSPLAKEETIKMELREEILDKIQMVVRSISEKKITKSELGTLTKSLENLMKAWSIFKGESTQSKLITINIAKMSLEQKKEASRRSAELD
jgi:hypothetical protein